MRETNVFQADRNRSSAKSVKIRRSLRVERGTLGFSKKRYVNYFNLNIKLIGYYAFDFLIC